MRELVVENKWFLFYGTRWKVKSEYMPPLVAHSEDSETEVFYLCTNVQIACGSFLHNWEQASLCCCWRDNFLENSSLQVFQETDHCKIDISICQYTIVWHKFIFNRNKNSF